MHPQAASPSADLAHFVAGAGRRQRRHHAVFLQRRRLFRLCRPGPGQGRERADRAGHHAHHQPLAAAALRKCAAPKCRAGSACAWPSSATTRPRSSLRRGRGDRAVPDPAGQRRRACISIRSITPRRRWRSGANCRVDEERQTARKGGLSMGRDAIQAECRRRGSAGPRFRTGRAQIAQRLADDQVRFHANGTQALLHRGFAQRGRQLAGPPCRRFRRQACGPATPIQPVRSRLPCQVPAVGTDDRMVERLADTRATALRLRARICGNTAPRSARQSRCVRRAGPSPRPAAPCRARPIRRRRRRAECGRDHLARAGTIAARHRLGFSFAAATSCRASWYWPAARVTITTSKRATRPTWVKS